MIAAIVQFAALLVAPTSAECPPSTWIEGVRPDGSYACMRSPAGDDPDTATRPATVIARGRIVCVAPEVPLVIDARHVACRRVP